MTYAKLSAPQSSQSRAAASFMSRFLEPNDLIVWLNGLLEDLEWGPEKTDRFEAAVRDLGAFLGFGSHRPEKEVGKGPDNLWAVGKLAYFVIERKSGATASQIAKSDCNQLTGSATWFTGAYDTTCQMTPIIVHPVALFDRYSSPLPATRVLEKSSLSNLKTALRGYGTALASGRNYLAEGEVTKLLAHYKLTAAAFPPAHTKGYSVSRNLSARDLGGSLSDLGSSG